jgi:hypothetical protein
MVLLASFALAHPMPVHAQNGPTSPEFAARKHLFILLSRETDHCLSSRRSAQTTCLDLQLRLAEIATRNAWIERENGKLVNPSSRLALEVATRALAYAEAKFGRSHSATARTRMTAALVLQRLARDDEAQAQYLLAYEAFSATGGTHGANALLARRHYLLIFGRNRRFNPQAPDWKKVEAHHRASVDAQFREIEGSYLRAFAGDRERIAELYLDMGDNMNLFQPAQAQEYYLRAVPYSLFEDQPTPTSILLYLRLARDTPHSESNVWHQRASEARRRVGPPHRYAVIDSLIVFADVARRDGRFSDALQLARINADAIRAEFGSGPTGARLSRERQRRGQVFPTLIRAAWEASQRRRTGR